MTLNPYWREVDGGAVYILPDDYDDEGTERVLVEFYPIGWMSLDPKYSVSVPVDDLHNWKDYL